MAYIKLNKNNFFNNLDIIAKKTKTVDKIALVLKDNAYGHGLVEISTLAFEYGIKKAVVRSEDEAYVIEPYFEYILILASTPSKPNQKFCYTINSLDDIAKMAPDSRVELKVDSGMHRNGIVFNELRVAFEMIKSASLRLEGVFTHHRSADELSSEWFWQKENFKKYKKASIALANEFGFDNLRFHSSNSASLFRYSDFDEDMVRVGIAIYGCLEMPKAFGVNGFRSVLSLWAKKNSSREIEPGFRVGYGGDVELKYKTTISNYDFGYGDGFFRICAKSDFATPNGTKLIGRISMDNSSFESSEDELCIFDNASKVAKDAQTISYEVLTSLKPSLTRVVI